MLPPSPAAAALLWCAGPLVLPIAVQVEAQEELAELAELLVAETRAPAGRRAGEGSRPFAAPAPWKGMDAERLGRGPAAGMASRGWAAALPSRARSSGARRKLCMPLRGPLATGGI